MNAVAIQMNGAGRSLKQCYVQSISKFSSFKMELQISRNLCAEKKEISNFRQDQGRPEENISRTGPTKGMPDRRGQSKRRSRAYVH